MKKFVSVLLTVSFLCVSLFFAGCNMKDEVRDNIQFYLSCSDEESEGYFKLNKDLSFEMSFKMFLNSYSHNVYEYKGDCVKIGSAYYISNINEINIYSKAFGYNVLHFDYSGTVTDLPTTLSCITENNMAAPFLKMTLLKKEGVTYSENEAVTVYSTKYNITSKSIKLIKGTDSNNLAGDLGLHFIYGSGETTPVSDDDDNFISIEGVDASKTGSYTAVITYGENKSVSYPVDVVDDYVTSWPGFNNSYQPGTKLTILSAKYIHCVWQRRVLSTRPPIW